MKSLKPTAQVSMGRHERRTEEIVLFRLLYLQITKRLTDLRFTYLSDCYGDLLVTPPNTNIRVGYNAILSCPYFRTFSSATLECVLPPGSARELE